ncbi:MAG: FAD-dependent tricarballylate dehydrogenase TcuA, partial [Rubrivivax sp.]|nr:FAD-dependent tricarballylate dehydrogenase TcuA [Rubrivivax sp.]
MVDVLVIGGGNAALCAALMAAEAGASVLLLEAAPVEWRGGNSQHTRNLRCMHDAPQDVLVGAYPEEEYWQDLLKVTGGITSEALARIAIRESATCRPWMRQHGVHFQPSLSGALHTARTNAFFMGGGKALVNAYYRSAARLGVQIRYDTPVDRLKLDGGRFVAAFAGSERIEARSCVLAAGGFESNLAWLREAWGQNERGEWPADNFLIRGTRFNTGTLLRHLIDAGADAIGDPTQAHMVAIDARAPLYDGGISTRLDTVSLGVVVNRD